MISGRTPSAGAAGRAASGRRASAAPRPPNVLRGIALMCLGVAMFPFMNAAVKLLTAHYPVMQIVWARFTGHLIVMLVVFCRAMAGACWRRGGPVFSSRGRC